MPKLIDVSLPELSYCMIDMAGIAYLDPPTAKKKLKKWKFNTFFFLDHDDTQAYVIVNKYDVIIACRGTERTSNKDILDDIKFWHSSEFSIGAVHHGFHDGADRIWEAIKKILLQNHNKHVWFTGHSMGGAIATVLAIRMFHDPDLDKPHRLVTFGSPHVTGWLTSIMCCKGIRHDRWVNHLDVVTHLPPALIGYRHFGTTMYINQWGNVSKYGWIRYRWDLLTGLIRCLCKRQAIYINCHHRPNYLEAITRYRNNIQLPETNLWD